MHAEPGWWASRAMSSSLTSATSAEALDHMNIKHNLQHLDIKPHNLFLVYDQVKVADFGLVKHLEGMGRR